MSGWKLLAGKLWSAWRAYPTQRRAFGELPAGAPILVTGAHRSGTTWVGAMLARPGIWHVHEPFNPNQGVWKTSFMYRRPSERDPAIDRFVRRLLSGRLRRMLKMPHVDHFLMPMRLLGATPRRVLIKDPLACLLSAYLATHHGFQVIAVFRHPCGFVASVRRLGWPTGAFLSEFLKRDELIKDHLADYRSILARFAGEDSIGAAAALTGALNRVLVNMTETFGWTAVQFEDLCEDPIRRFRELYNRLDIPYDASVHHLHVSLTSDNAKPSADYYTHAVKRNSAAMAERWRQELTTDEIHAITDIWASFDLGLHPGRTCPAEHASRRTLA